MANWKEKLISGGKSMVVDLVKAVAFRSYGLLFNCAARLPVKENRIVLFSLHDANFTDGLGEVELELKKRAAAGGTNYEIIRVDRQDMLAGGKRLLKFLTVDNLRMARAKFIFMNNNFLAMAYMNPNPDTTVVQVWHGQGAFKKFGYDIPQPKKIRKREIGANRNMDYVVCSAPWVKPIYMSAFGLPAEKVLDTGNPVQDYYFREENAGPLACASRRAAFDEKYPDCKNKYLVMYAPTFRDDGSRVLDHMDFARLKAAIDRGLQQGRIYGETMPDGSPLPKECQILLRLHPVEARSVGPVVESGVTDLSHYPDSNALSFLADVMITDYSSICMNFALLEKPTVYYAYDKETYLKDRNFYFDYEDVSGPICTTMDELCATFESRNFAPEKMDYFRNLHFGHPTPGATGRLLDAVGVK